MKNLGEVHHRKRKVKPIERVQKSLDVMILKAINGKSLRVSEIQRAITERSDGLFVASTGVVNPALNRLELYIRRTAQTSPTGHKIYRLTLNAAGKRRMIELSQYWRAAIRGISKSLEEEEWVERQEHKKKKRAEAKQAETEERHWQAQQRKEKTKPKKG